MRLDIWTSGQLVRGLDTGQGGVDRDLKARTGVIVARIKDNMLDSGRGVWGSEPKRRRGLG